MWYSNMPKFKHRYIVAWCHYAEMRFLAFFLIFFAAFPFVAQAQNNRDSDDDGEYERIVSEQDFVKRVVGKRLFYDSGAVIVFLADRSFGGGFSGSRVWGEWAWQDDRICHQINIGEKRYEAACKVPQIVKNRLRFIREDGSFYGVAKIR